MHLTEIQRWQHHHYFNQEKKSVERKTLFIVLLTLSTMLIEIIAGWIYNSMALLADGWHMGTHAFALGISLSAYVLARKHAENACFAFGTWKIEILGAYTSALLLGVASAAMTYTSIERFIKPLLIHYNEALFVAVAGLAVNIASAIILNTSSSSHANHHNQSNLHDHEHHSHNDLNLKSAYLHVVADALTSVFAIVALLGAKYMGFNWLDPFMGIVGAALIARWSILLLRDSGSILLDHEKASPISHKIREHIESDGDTRIADLHLWKVAEGNYACIISVVSSVKRPIDEYKMRLGSIHELAHITIEINECPGAKK